MHFKKKTNSKFIIIIIFLLFALWLACVICINSIYPQPKEVFVPIGKPAIINDIAITVKNSGVIELENPLIAEHLTNNNSMLPLFLEGNENLSAKMLYAEIELVNQGQVDATFDSTALVAECAQWTNGLDVCTLAPDNETVAYSIKLKSDQTESIYVFWNLLDMHFSDKNWNNIETLKFTVPLSLYPKKVMLELN